MIFNRETKERIRLLEYENKILADKIKEIEKQLKPIMPSFPESTYTTEGCIDMSYSTLRKKYRSFKEKFTDGF